MLTLNLLSSQNYTFLILALGFLILPNITLEAQENWTDYVTIKDRGVMSIAVDLRFKTVDMRINTEKPNFKNLVIVGTRFQPCLKNGFPKEESLDELYAYSDSISAVINKTTRNVLVGIITYQCMGFDVYYVKDTLNIRANLNTVIQENFNEQDAYIAIRQEKSWDYYYNFLYPKKLSMDFFLDQEYLHDLVLQGDDLKGLRKVNHWLYFKNVKLRNTAGAQLKKLEFSLDSIAYKKDLPHPYELIISRNDSITPGYINQLTSMLRILSAAYKGQYDGWGTELKVLE